MFVEDSNSVVPEGSRSRRHGCTVDKRSIGQGMGGSLMEHILFLHSRDGGGTAGEIGLDRGQLSIGQFSVVIGFV